MKQQIEKLDEAKRTIEKLKLAIYHKFLLAGYIACCALVLFLSYSIAIG